MPHNCYSMRQCLVVVGIPGCVAVFVSSPLWVANTRLKLQGVSIGSRGCSNSGHRLPTYSGIVGMQVSCLNCSLLTK